MPTDWHVPEGFFGTAAFGLMGHALRVISSVPAAKGLLNLSGHDGVRSG